MAATEWVARTTTSDRATNTKLFEEGAVYSDAEAAACEDRQQLQTGDPECRCPRCGRRFVATAFNTAEENRDLHLDGDEDSPSICR